MAVGTFVISGTAIKTGAGATAPAQTLTGVQGIIIDFGRQVMTVDLSGSGQFGGVPAGAASGNNVREFDISASSTLTDTIASQNHTITIS